MTVRLSAALAVAALMSAVANAQTITTTGTLRTSAPEAVIAPAAQPVVLAQPATTNAVLRAGTPITLRLMEEITTKEKAARVGQRIRMEVAAPVEFNGAVVIPAGSPAEGEITDVRNKGAWGKSGKLVARALWARVGGRQIRLSGVFDDKGVVGTGAVVGAIVTIPVLGFFTTGTSAKLPMGTQVAAFLDEDLELAIKQAAPAPLEVTAPVAPIAVAAPAGE